MWLSGGGLRFEYVRRRLIAGLDVAALTTTERFDLGTAQILLTYGSPYVAWLLTSGLVQIRLGAGAALRVARLTGHATAAGAFAGTTNGPWTAPYAFGGAALELRDGLHVEARGQLGWASSPVIGEVSTGREIAPEGVWASVQLGVAITL